MAVLSIDLTTPQPNGEFGESFRSAFTKVNTNFTDIDARINASNTSITNVDTRVTALQNTRPQRLVNGDWLQFSGGNNITVNDIGPSSDTYGYTAPAEYTTIIGLPAPNDFTGIALSASFSSVQRFWMRARQDTLGPTPWQRWKPWVELWHTGNTTVDANNFIKRA